MKFLIADDHEIIFAGLENCIKKEFFEPEIFTAKSSIIAKEILKKVEINYLITDLRMETKESGLELCRFAKKEFPEIKIIVFSQFDNPYNIYETYKLGIRVFLDKVNLQSDFSKAIYAANENRKYYSQHVSNIVENYFYTTNCKLPDNIIPQLTTRQKEYLNLISKGHSNEEIADNLCVSVNSVKDMKKELFLLFEIEGDSKLKSGKLTSKATELGII